MPCEAQHGAINPSAGHTQTVQSAEHPKLAVGKVVRPGILFANRHTGAVSSFENEVNGDAPDARCRRMRAHQRLTSPPEQAAVGALDDATLGINDHGFTGPPRLHGDPQKLQSLKIRALYERDRARVVRCSRHVNFARDRGSRPQPQHHLGAVDCVTQFDARKPVTRERHRRNNVSKGRVSVTTVGRCRANKTRAVTLKPPHTTVDHTPRVSHQQAAVIVVTTVERQP